MRACGYNRHILNNLLAIRMLAEIAGLLKSTISRHLIELEKTAR